MWDPSTYLRFSDERSRPFFDLLARVDAPNPTTVVDLGCGPGNLTTYLAQRWPDAEVRGFDTSTKMIDAARALGTEARFEVGDVRDWHATSDVGVVVCNAVLHWVPGHDVLVARWLGELAESASLAVQVPGNFDGPAYRAIREVAALWGLADRVPAADSVRGAADYASMLVAQGHRVDAWETTYVHQLPVSGKDHPVLRWFEGTGLRAVRSTVDDAGWDAFRAELNPRLESTYPSRDGHVFFPFRRVFLVARP